MPAAPAHVPAHEPHVPPFTARRPQFPARLPAAPAHASPAAFGRAGFIPHVLLLALFAPLLGVGTWAFDAPIGTRAATALGAVVLGAGAAFAGGHQVNSKRLTIPLAVVFGLWTAWAPIAASELVRSIARRAGLGWGQWTETGLVLFLAIFAATFALGALLSTLTALGVENTLAITTLAHPGFKHFVRMRVRRDGSRVDAWVIGLVDPLAADARPALVDRWSWEPWPLEHSP